MNPLDINNKNKEFWFSHLIILFATVIGVYMAASAGLKSAIQFELIKSNKDSYYMRTAILDELNDNIKNMQKWGTFYRHGGVGSFWRNPDDYVLDTYVWDAMKEQASTFEIPSSILTKIRRYYAKNKIVLKKMKSRGAAADIVDKMLIENKKFENTVIIALSKNIKDLKIVLGKHGVTIN